jgi:hypothetical protein
MTYDVYNAERPFPNSIRSDSEIKPQHLHSIIYSAEFSQDDTNGVGVLLSEF